MAMGVAETKMADNPLTNKAADWRFKNEPATEAQINLAARMNIKWENKTKSELADLIDERMFSWALSSVKKQLKDIK